MRLARAVVDRSAEGAAALGMGYWEEFDRACRGLVRCRHVRGGVDLRLLGRAPLLLSLGPAVLSAGEGSAVCHHPITGGLLARRAGGAIRFEQSGSGPVELRMAVTGYFPTLGPRPGWPFWSGALYDLLQRRLHLALSRRYFARLIAGAGQ